ncbi:hypothetical protein BRAS3843_2560027 [Bradyrhizobium sp. STM 3843]|nr:hypothetical protein BRAS3843_2560027 [Bradyrhizobium sp. STM 3843]
MLLADAVRLTRRSSSLWPLTVAFHAPFKDGRGPTIRFHFCLLGIRATPLGIGRNSCGEDDRLAHLLMRGDGRADYDAARRKLDRAALVLTADVAASLPWGPGGAADRRGTRRAMSGRRLGRPRRH